MCQPVRAVEFPAVPRPNANRSAARPARSAFTLIELLLVLVILAILAGIILPRFTGHTERAKNTSAKTQISNLKVALNNFEVDNGRFPTNEEGLAVLVNKPGNAPDWHGPYMEQVPLDPWGNSFIYRFPGSINPSGFDLISMGPDGHEGGGDDIQ